MHSPKQAAKLLSVSRSMVYKLVRKGLLSCYRIGNLIKITDEHIKEFLESTKNDAPKSRRRRNQRLRDIEL